MIIDNTFENCWNDSVKNAWLKGEKLSLISYPAPILKKVCIPFNFENPQVDLFYLLSEMKRIMKSENGIGLAAPQVGVPLRIFIVDGEHSDNIIDKKFEPMVFINPTITITGKEKAELPEGCLSFPLSTPTNVERPLWVSVHAFDIAGNLFELDADILLGRILQHENDHLNGKTLYDHAKGMSRELMRNRLKKSNRNK